MTGWIITQKNFKLQENDYETMFGGGIALHINIIINSLMINFSLKQKSTLYVLTG